MQMPCDGSSSKLKRFVNLFTPGTVAFSPPLFTIWRSSEMRNGSGAVLSGWCLSGLEICRRIWNLVLLIIVCKSIVAIKPGHIVCRCCSLFLRRRIYFRLYAVKNWGIDGCIGRDLEGSGFDLIEIYFYSNLPGGTEGVYEHFSLESRYLAKIKNCIGGVLLAGERRSVWRKTCSSVPPCLPQISYGLTQNRTRASVMRDQQVAASTLAWTFRDLRLQEWYLKKSYLKQCYLKINFVPRIKRAASWVKTKRLMLLGKSRCLFCVGRM